MSAPLLLLAAVLAASAQDLPKLSFKKSQDQAPVAAPAGSCLDKLDPAAPPTIDGRPVPSGSFASKVESRDFPSVFMAWEPASGLGKAASLARHDLVWLGPGGWGLKGNSKYPGLATAYTGTIAQAGADTVRLAELRWYDGMFVEGDASKQYLPKGHAFWGGAMTKANSTLTSPMFMLDYRDPCLQEQVARQCKALVAAGLDGCMLDRWSDIDPDTAVGLLKKIREAIGGSGLVIVNANGHNASSPGRGGQVLSASLPYINGVYAEGFGASFWPSGRGYAQVPYPSPEAWRYLISDLKALESSMQSPRINAIEGWGDAGDQRYLRSLTAAVLAYSDAYVLYSRSNQVVPNHDHTHDWAAFWDKGLGRPAGDATPLGADAARREFSGGTVVYNGSAAPLPVSFPSPRTSRATGATASLFQVPAGDGDIFLKAAN